MKKITIIGFGNVGKSLLHKISDNFEVNVLTFSKGKRAKNIVTKFKDERYENYVKEITHDLDILIETDILILTIPNFLREDIIKKIKRYLDKETLILFIPGIGPSQFIANKYLIDYKVACLERVPFIVREEEDIVEITDDRKLIKYATLNKEDNYDEIIQKMFQKPVEKVSYSSVTLTSSNAILHTSRMFALFNKNENKVFNKKIYFYSDWNNEASIVFQECDNEIMLICENLKTLKIIDEKIQSLMDYYESKTPQELTDKINSINSFKNIKLEMLKIDEEKYTLNRDTRFLTEDIPYGLIMFKGIAEILNIKTPTIDRIIEWAQIVLEKDYISKGQIKNTENVGSPQYYDIKSIKELSDIFSR